MMESMLLHLCLSALLAFPVGSGFSRAQETEVDGLLDADRTFSRMASGKSAVDAISAMFADDVMLPVPGNAFAEGKARAIEAFKANPDNLTARVEWTPIRAGISADGMHGFTFGFMTQTKADGTRVPLKYLAYWVKASNGWRVAAYRRRPRPEGPVSTQMMAPSVPRRMQPPAADPAILQEHAASLTAAEKAFSDEAQKIGLGAAFAKHGREDAVNMGGPDAAGFVIGAEAIGRAVGEGSPTDRSEVEWSADRVRVASSGDLGITFGMIRFHEPKKGQPAAVPFFTIWRRDDTSLPWRYIAE
jgi:ketosteroid isomerase-like protein